MEVYYKDLISKEATLEKLVDDLMLVVQGMDELVDAAGARLQPSQLEEMASGVVRLKRGCRHLQARARQSALAANRLLHEHPYSALGFALGLGLLAGVLFSRRGR